MNVDEPCLLVFHLHLQLVDLNVSAAELDSVLLHLLFFGDREIIFVGNAQRWEKVRNEAANYRILYFFIVVVI